MSVKKLPNFHPISVSLQAFFTDTYMHEHPEDHERIEVLKHLIALQVNLLTVIVVDTGSKCSIHCVIFKCPSSPLDPSFGRRDSHPWGEVDRAAEAFTQPPGYLLPGPSGESGEALWRHNLGELPTANSI